MWVWLATMSTFVQSVPVRYTQFTTPLGSRSSRVYLQRRGHWTPRPLLALAKPELDSGCNRSGRHPIGTLYEDVRAHAPISHAP